MRTGRFVGAALSVLAAVCAVMVALAQELHYSPEERLDAIDAALIAGAKCAAGALAFSLAAPVTAAFAEDSIYVPLLTYRTGAFAGSADGQLVAYDATSGSTSTRDHLFSP